MSAASPEYIHLWVFLAIILGFLLSLTCRKYWYARIKGRSWTGKLCGCYMCCRGFWCIPCMVGANGEAIDNKSSPVDHKDPVCKGCLARDCVLYTFFDMCGMGWLVIGNQRQRLREKHQISGDSADDLACSLCCHCCTVCQTAEELALADDNSEETRPLQTNKRNVGGFVVEQPHETKPLDMNV